MGELEEGGVGATLADPVVDELAPLYADLKASIENYMGLHRKRNGKEGSRSKAKVSARQQSMADRLYGRTRTKEVSSMNTLEVAPRNGTADHGEETIPLVTIDKKYRIVCSVCPAYGTNAPSLWADHIRSEHGGLNPNTGHKLVKRHRTVDRKPLEPMNPFAGRGKKRGGATAAEATWKPGPHQQVIEDLEAQKAKLDQAITLIRQVMTP